MANSDSTAASSENTIEEQQPSKMVRNFLSMGRGDGQGSYVKSSTFQQSIIDSSQSLLISALDRLNLPAADSGPFSISDLGCSSGPNTIKIVSDVVTALKERYQLSGQDVPEFKAYFNDLPSTDFNILFQLLDSEARDFYYAAVPGSFYGRLLPRSSVNVFLSTNTLHWISQIPPTLTDKNSPSYNKDRIWVHGSNVDVINAYREQGIHDMRAFLDARAEELVPGGLLFCLFGNASKRSGNSLEDWLRPLSEDTSSSVIMTLRVFEHVWDELISEGILSEEQRTMCNFPWYMFSLEEVKEILKSYDDIFQIEILDLVVLPPSLDSVNPLYAKHYADLINRHLGSTFGPFFTNIIGKDLTSTFLSRSTEKLIGRQRYGKMPDYVSNAFALIRK